MGRILKLLPWLFLAASAGMVAGAAFLWFDHTRETALLAVTGRFAVGRTSYAWSDPAHEDPLAPQRGTKRELIAWIWYPAEARESSRNRDYLPPAWLAATQKQRFWLFELLERDLSRVRVRSLRDADLSPARPSYPIVLMRAGGSTSVTSYTSLAEDLASHGFVVVGLDVPYRTSLVVFPDGRVIERSPRNDLELVDGSDAERLATQLTDAASGDMSFALDGLRSLNDSDPSGRFRGRLDLARVGAFGHSIGGAEALEFCHDDARCKACIDVDGLPWGSVVREGLTQPVMFLLSDHSGESGRETQVAGANFGSIFEKLGPNQWSEIVIRGGNHFLFSDDAILRSPPLMRVIRAVHLVGIDGPRQVRIASHLISAFFDTHLNGAPAAEARTEYPELQYLH